MHSPLSTPAALQYFQSRSARWLTHQVGSVDSVFYHGGTKLPSLKYPGLDVYHTRMFTSKCIPYSDVYIHLTCSFHACHRMLNHFRPLRSPCIIFCRNAPKI